MLSQSLRSLLGIALIVPLFACGQGTTQQAQQPGIELASQTKTTPAGAQPTTLKQNSTEAYIEGVHYIKVGEPQLTEDNKIEVVEIFWYGCPHCYSTEPFVRKWETTKPANAEFAMVAAPLAGIWEFHAKVYYANKTLGIDEQVHQATFNAIHRDGLRMDTLNQVSNFYAKNFAVDKEKYERAFSSFSVDLETKRALKLLQEYNIQGVPNFIVGGAYRVDSQSAGSTPGIFNVINFLIRNKF